MVESITLNQLQSELAGDDAPILVEALSPLDYEDRHLPGAINIPHDEVEELAPTLLPDKDAPIVVYCANAACQNSALAARRLARLGYTNVRDYEEGKAEWVEAGLPTESGAVTAVR
jgi:rhodanese-related sulfurtransferase